MKLYKTTITIYTDCHTMVDGDEWDLETLAREAFDGGAICGAQTCEQVKCIEDLPEGVASFFDVEILDGSPPAADDDDDWRHAEGCTAKSAKYTLRALCGEHLAREELEMLNPQPQLEQVLRFKKFTRKVRGLDLTDGGGL